MKRLLLLLFAMASISPFYTNGAELNQVTFNEIAWMGTANSANDEWVELKNATPLPIDLTGWKIESSNQKLKITLSGVIEANGFYILERTDNTSLPDISANLIYTGALSNSGLKLVLYDSENNIIDIADCQDSWCAGNNTTKQTMERGPSGLWQTSQNSLGTPGAQNSPGAPKILPKPQAEIKQSLPINKISDNTNVKESLQKPSDKILDTSSPTTTENKIKNPWILFFLTLFFTIFLGAIILVIKFTQSNKIL